MIGHKAAAGLSLLCALLFQYWRSFNQLEAFPRDRDVCHWPAWVDFNKRISSSGEIGIWHETYLVTAGRYNSIYNNMPASGRKAAAASRAGMREQTYPTDVPTERIDL